MAADTTKKRAKPDLVARVGLFIGATQAEIDAELKHAQTQITFWTTRAQRLEKMRDVFSSYPKEYLETRPNKGGRRSPEAERARTLIVGLLKEKPGLKPSQIEEQTGLTHVQVDNALSVLKRRKQIVAVRASYSLVEQPT